MLIAPSKEPGCNAYKCYDELTNWLLKIKDNYANSPWMEALLLNHSRSNHQFLILALLQRITSPCWYHSQPNNDHVPRWHSLIVQNHICPIWWFGLYHHYKIRTLLEIPTLNQVNSKAHLRGGPKVLSPVRTFDPVFRSFGNYQKCKWQIKSFEQLWTGAMAAFVNSNLLCGIFSGFIIIVELMETKEECHVSFGSLSNSNGTSSGLTISGGAWYSGLRAIFVNQVC